MAFTFVGKRLHSRRLSSLVAAFARVGLRFARLAFAGFPTSIVGAQFPLGRDCRALTVFVGALETRLVF